MNTRTHLLDDPYLDPYREIIQRRAVKASQWAAKLAQGPGSLAEFACAHEYYGLHKKATGRMSLFGAHKDRTGLL